jgi:hypothetical protein
LKERQGEEISEGQGAVEKQRHGGKAEEWWQKDEKAGGKIMLRLLRIDGDGNLKGESLPKVQKLLCIYDLAPS